MDLEEKFVRMELKEENHLAVLYNSSFYRGWYRYDLDSEEVNKDYADKQDMVKEFKDIVVRFRMPPAIPLYNDVLRAFSEDERIVGIHRLPVGKDLKDITGNLLNLEEYVKNLKDEEVKELLGRMKSLVTLDCNRVPYLHIRKEKSQSLEDVDTQVKNFVKKHPDYLRMLYDVLNENISIAEATRYSGRVIYNEIDELNQK